jgi:hypothetical protein
MKDIAIGLLGDALSAKAVAVSGGVSGAVSMGISKMLSKRHKLLQEVVRSEIRQGNFDRVDEDELISIFFRLIRDAEEGVARNNLRLMARVINGMAEKKELRAPSFLRYASILSSLSEEEITVLGIMAKDVAKEVRTYTGEMHLRDPLQVADAGKDELHRSGLEYRSIQQALLRTGLIAMDTVSETKQTKKPDTGQNMMYASGRKDSGFDIETKTSQTFRLTPLMVEVLEYTDSFDLKDL